MSSTDTSTVYNTTDGPLIIDQAGRVLDARTRSTEPVDVTSSPVAGHIKADRLVVVEDTVDASPADDVAVEAVEAPTPTPRSKRGATTTQEG